MQHNFKNRLMLIVCMSLLFPIAAICAEKGDLNGNGGAPGLEDAIVGLKVLDGIADSGLIGNYAASGADVNGDNKAGQEEVIYVLQYAASLRAGGTFTLQSSDFSDNGFIPAENACPPEAMGISPALSWNNAPANTQSFVLIMDDPDAGQPPWDHWIVYDIPASVSSLVKNAGASGVSGLPAGAKHGSNSWNNNFYGGPCPPSGTHRYYFRLYALSTASLGLNSGASRAQVEAAMQNFKLGESAILMGKYPQ